MKKKLAIIMAMVLIIGTLAGCGGNSAGDNSGSLDMDKDTWTIKDGCGREIEMTGEIERVAPTGAAAEMILMTIAPEKMVGLSNKPSKEQEKYYPDEVKDLPVFGQLYGSKSNLNKEALLAADPQLIIDVGENREGMAEEIDALQEELGVPVIFVDGSLEKTGNCYRVLGAILDAEERTDKLVEFIDEALQHASSRAKKMEDEERVSIYYGTGPDGLACNPAGSPQAELIDFIGAVNAIEVPENEVTGKNGGTIISKEKLYEVNPDVVLLTDKAAYESFSGKEWAELPAVKADTYNEVPAVPYCWTGGPPSVNRILGIWWLGNLVYPEYYNFNIQEKVKEFYDLFWGYELSDEEVNDMLKNSSLKW